MSNHVQASLVAELFRHGISHHRVERKGKHPRLCFTAGGRERSFVFPGSPSDQRAGRNAVTELRCVLRNAGCSPVDEGRAVKPAAPKKHKTRTAARPVTVPQCEHIALQRDPFAALAALSCLSR